MNMAEFLKKVIPLSSELKNWLNNTFSPVDHKHEQIQQEITQIKEDMKSLSCGGDMPDFARAVLMERPKDDYNTNPGTIYKINVPGYFYTHSAHGGWQSAMDFWFKVAEHPGYLFRHQDNAGAFGDYNRPAYNDKRCTLYSQVEGNYLESHIYPIIPGTSTYMRTCNASSHNAWVYLYFVPCKGLPEQYKPSDYFTRVGRGENQISTSYTQAVLTDIVTNVLKGKWSDNFIDYVLDNNNVTTITGTFTCGSWAPGSRWHIVDPIATGVDRAWWRHGGDNEFTIRWVSSETVDQMINGMTTVQLSYVLSGGRGTRADVANRMRDKWCITHRTFNAQTAVNKLDWCAWIDRRDGFQNSPPTGTDALKDDIGTELWYYGGRVAKNSKFDLWYSEPTIDDSVSY